MSKRSFPLLDRLLLESKVTESVVDRSVGVKVVLSNSETSAILSFSKVPLQLCARDTPFVIM